MGLLEGSARIPLIVHSISANLLHIRAEGVRCPGNLGPIRLKQLLYAFSAEERCLVSPPPRIWKYKPFDKHGQAACVFFFLSQVTSSVLASPSLWQLQPNRKYLVTRIYYWSSGNYTLGYGGSSIHLRKLCT